MLIQWSEKYETGVAQVDEQHKEIIKQLNRLHQAVTSGQAKEVITDIVNFAGNYAAKHFAFEESCMDKYNCPVAKQNKDAHHKFIQRFGEIQKVLQNENPDTATILSVYKELRDWVHNHILKIDTNLKACASTHKQ